MQQEFEIKPAHFIQIHKSSVYKSLYLTIPTPLEEFRPRNLKQSRVLLLHLTLELSGSFSYNMPLPQNPYQRDGFLP